MLSATLGACTSSTPKSEIVVSVKDQKLGLYSQGELKKAFTISTSKFGIGDQPNSYRTPLGKHEVIAKIGHGLPTGAVLKSRHWNGEVLKPNAPGRDPIVSRILWLRGMETTNRNAMNRFIYIHGTTEENRLGKPASYGCIRMGMRDVVDLFNDVGIGAKVVVTRNPLPAGEKIKEAPLPKAEIVVAGMTEDTSEPDAKKGAVAPASGIPTDAIPVGPANAVHAKVDKKGKSAPTKETAAKPVVKEVPVAKGKSSKKSSSKNEKITTGNRRVSSMVAHG
ncbi:MAG: L,D-transpeptidase family protein [Verrucomicrobiota bacterium]